MHHVFELDEILRIIAKNLTDTGRSGLQGALSLACCCKPFSAPVLDTMWEEEQTDFVVLLKTFPQSVWEITDHTFVSLPHQLPIEWDLTPSKFSTLSTSLRRRNGNGFLFTPDGCVHSPIFCTPTCAYPKWP
jgi:hypothetical protein